MQTIDIARICQIACITAVDVYHAFLEDVNKRVIEAGFTGRVRTVQASMDALPFYPASFDVIWAEGSIFILGVERGITLLKKLIKSGGFIRFTEVIWFTHATSEKVRFFWQDNYPGMKTVEEIKTIASEAGYATVVHFPLPPSAWRADYYSPLLSRLPALEHQYRDMQRQKQSSP